MSTAAQTEIRAGCFARDLFVCQWCGLPARPEADSCHHRWLKGQGGPDAPHNRVILCGSGSRGCHGKAHNADREEAERLGYIVRSWAGPQIAAVPYYSTPLRSWVVQPAGFNKVACDPPPHDDARLAVTA